MSQRIPIELSLAEVSVCMHVAQMRELGAMKSKSQNLERDAQQLDFHLQSALSECAFAKWKDLFWGYTNRASEDVFGYQIKSARNERGSLIVKRDDVADAVYVLVLIRNNRSLVLRGWIRGKDAKQDRYWGPGPVYSVPVYSVPQQDLRDMGEMP